MLFAFTPADPNDFWIGTLTPCPQNLMNHKHPWYVKIVVDTPPQHLVEADDADAAWQALGLMPDPDPYGGKFSTRAFPTLGPTSSGWRLFKVPLYAPRDAMNLARENPGKWFYVDGQTLNVKPAGFKSQVVYLFGTMGFALQRLTYDKQAKRKSDHIKRRKGPTTIAVNRAAQSLFAEIHKEYNQLVLISSLVTKDAVVPRFIQIVKLYDSLYGKRARRRNQEFKQVVRLWQSRDPKLPPLTQQFAEWIEEDLGTQKLCTTKPC